MFMEDMTDLQLAQAVSYPARPVAARFLITFHQVAFPVGLENLGTPTCPRYDQIVLTRRLFRQYVLHELDDPGSAPNPRASDCPQRVGRRVSVRSTALIRCAGSTSPPRRPRTMLLSRAR